MIRTAIFDKSKKYRYRLFRCWDSLKPAIMFIMLNPSTADEHKDDPTIRRCISLAKEWGYGSLFIGNVYAYRSTDPKALKILSEEEAEGTFNLFHLSEMASATQTIVVAWGNHGPCESKELANLLKGKDIKCLSINKNGTPKHPLYCKKDSFLVDYSIRGGN